MTNFVELADRLKAELAKTIVGQSRCIEEVLVALFAGGHVVIEGVPGLAKTLLAKSLAYTIDARFTRIQFTPDLMPGDVTGANIFDMAENRFNLVKGPVFTQVLLADEINRTPPKTQAALLEAMEERQVTIDGERHPLGFFFFVLATQNPIEYEGTYPLPEAQIDRFLLKTRIDYPSGDQEIDVLKKHNAGLDPADIESAGINKVITVEELLAARNDLKEIRVDDGLYDYIVRVVGGTRTHHHLTLGASPRASLAFLQAAKVVAALGGRDFVTPDDVKRMAMPVLRHRLIPKPEAEIEGISTDDIVEQVLAEVEIPR
ncbi:MAG: AAA domain-containing protein [Anaerolineaceae bacterium]|nr:AAA domain-containing protein [Anaerolineaceae bacterium]